MTARAAPPNTCRTCSSLSTAHPAAARPTGNSDWGYSLSIHTLRQWAGTAASRVLSGPAPHFAYASPHHLSQPRETEGIKMLRPFHPPLILVCNNLRRTFDGGSHSATPRRFLALSGLPG